MATLEKMDRIKTELQTAKQGLHEADNWTVLANDVEEVSPPLLLPDNQTIDRKIIIPSPMLAGFRVRRRRSDIQ